MNWSGTADSLRQYRAEIGGNMSDHAATLHEAARIVAAKGAVHMPELIELLKPHSPGPEVTEKLEVQLMEAAQFKKTRGAASASQPRNPPRLPKAAPQADDGA